MKSHFLTINFASSVLLSISTVTNAVSLVDLGSSEYALQTHVGKYGEVTGLSHLEKGATSEALVDVITDHWGEGGTGYGKAGPITEEQYNDAMELR